MLHLCCKYFVTFPTISDGEETERHSFGFVGTNKQGSLSNFEYFVNNILSFKRSDDLCLQAL